MLVTNVTLNNKSITDTTPPKKIGIKIEEPPFHQNS